MVLLTSQGLAIVQAKRNAALGRHLALLPQFRFQQPQTLVDDGQGLVELFLRNDQRRVKTQIVALSPVGAPSARNGQAPGQGVTDFTA